jgi:hypothetical protein
MFSTCARVRREDALLLQALSERGHCSQLLNLFDLASSGNPGLPSVVFILGASLAILSDSQQRETMSFV